MKDGALKWRRYSYRSSEDLDWHLSTLPAPHCGKSPRQRALYVTNSSDVAIIYNSDMHSDFAGLHFCSTSFPGLTGCAGWLLGRSILSLPLPLIIGCFQLLLKLHRKGSKHLRVHLAENKSSVKPELILYGSCSMFFSQNSLFSNHAFLIYMNS